jgi:hypothetical protein
MSASVHLLAPAIAMQPHFPIVRVGVIEDERLTLRPQRGISLFARGGEHQSHRAN